MSNAASALAAVESLQALLPVKVEAIAKAMQQVQLAGRFQTVSRSTPTKKQPWVILDVAHNPHAARALAENLQASRMPNSKTFAVFAMLADKDIQGVVEALRHEIDTWYVASIAHIRGAKAEDLAAAIKTVTPKANIQIFDSADSAYQQACFALQACKDARESDKIVVFGSFFTVSTVLQGLLKT
jgi:dihydrofolate synthase/folylpolyglutamate synthase